MKKVILFLVVSVCFIFPTVSVAEVGVSFDTDIDAKIIDWYAEYLANMKVPGWYVLSSSVSPKNFSIEDEFGHLLKIFGSECSDCGGTVVMIGMVANPDWVKKIEAAVKKKSNEKLVLKVLPGDCPGCIFLSLSLGSNKFVSKEVVFEFRRPTKTSIPFWLP